MQFKAVFAIFVTAALAQDLRGLPACAKPCFSDNFSESGCERTDDYSCLCQSKAYNNAVGVCVAKGCESDDAKKARTWAQDKCREAGHPI